MLFCCALTHDATVWRSELQVFILLAPTWALQHEQVHASASAPYTFLFFCSSFLGCSFLFMGNSLFHRVVLVICTYTRTRVQQFLHDFRVNVYSVRDRWCHSTDVKYVIHRMSYAFYWHKVCTLMRGAFNFRWPCSSGWPSHFNLTFSPPPPLSPHREIDARQRLTCMGDV